MRRHRNPRPRLQKPPAPDNQRALPPPEPDELVCLLEVLRDNIRRADAFISTAEHQIQDNWHDDDSDEEDSEEDRKMRHRMRIEYLVEAGKMAVRAALYTADQLDAMITAQRRRA